MASNQVDKKFHSIVLFSVILLIAYSLIAFFEEQFVAKSLMFVGSIYGLILWLSIYPKPTILSSIAMIVVLGVANFFCIYIGLFSSVILYPLKDLISDPLFRMTGEFIMYFIGGVVGAFVTINCLRSIWGVNISKPRTYFIYALILMSSFLVVLISDPLESFLKRHGYNEMFYMTNSLFWWLVFSIGLVVPEKNLK